MGPDIHFGKTNITSHSESANTVIVSTFQKQYVAHFFFRKQCGSSPTKPFFFGKTCYIVFKKFHVPQMVLLHKNADKKPPRSRLRLSWMKSGSRGSWCRSGQVSSSPKTTCHQGLEMANEKEKLGKMLGELKELKVVFLDRSTSIEFPGIVLVFIFGYQKYIFITSTHRKWSDATKETNKMVHHLFGILGLIDLCGIFWVNMKTIQ